MKIAILAGEVSGDRYGALLAGRLRAAAPGVSLAGTGGAAMRAAGVSMLAEMPAAAMAFTDVLARLPAFRRAFRRIVAALTADPPDLAVFIDNPGFNLRVAGAVGPRIPCWYYIPPKVWAHGRGRVAEMRRRLRGVVAAFPFEKELYERAGIPCAWFGHPVLDIVPPEPETGPVRAAAGDGPIAGFLPGSRAGEVSRLMPPLIAVARRLGERGPRPVFSAADAAAGRLVRGAMARAGVSFPIVEGAYPLMKAAAAVLAASGTANLETALYGTPMVVCYRLGAANYLAARCVVQLDMASPVNILLRERAVPEYIQRIPAGEVAARLAALCGAGPERSAQTAAFRRLRESLGTGPATDAVARFLLDRCSENT